MTADPTGFAQDRTADMSADGAEPGGLIPREHPEGTCQDCGGPNVVWHAPNDLWNAVVGDQRGLVLCPLCFVVRADALCHDATGKLPTGWRLTIEDPHGEFGPSGGTDAT